MQRFRAAKMAWQPGLARIRPPRYNQKLMEKTAPHAWPATPLDAAVLVAFIAVAIALPVLGYIFAYVDFRRYLRSLRRAISTIVLSRYGDARLGPAENPALHRCFWPGLALFGRGADALLSAKNQDFASGPWRRRASLSSAARIFRRSAGDGSRTRNRRENSCRLNGIESTWRAHSIIHQWVARTPASPRQIRRQRAVTIRAAISS